MSTGTSFAPTFSKRNAAAELQRMRDARARTDDLFALLAPDALYDRPVPERHRLIFYLGHLEAFDWNQIGRGMLDLPSFHAEFDRLFEFGIDPPIGQEPQDQPSDWPSAQEVRRYNAEARQRIDAALEHAPQQIVNVALEHRLMHAETFAYLLHNLPHDRKRRPAHEHADSGPAPALEMIDIPEGDATLGQSGDSFGWDNEFSEHKVHVPAFRISRHKITNGQYLGFVRDGGASPFFWARHEGQWFYRGMFESIPLPVDWPVYVNHQQGEAFARWAGKALPGEAQFHRAAYATAQGSERAFPWGNNAEFSGRGNFDFARWEPESVRAHASSASAFGVEQLLGNGWEWTSTRFAPFAGFAPFSFYPGYSQNFFDNEHFVMKGASPRTAAPFLRRSFRNWFRPDYSYVYGSFRVVEG